MKGSPNLRTVTRAFVASRVARASPLMRRITATATAEAEAARPVQLVRDRLQRRRYAGDPWAYMHDIFGFRLTRDQEEALGLIEKYDRVLIPSGNNLGKTFLLAGYGIYRLDAVAALPDEDRGLEEQGGQVLLPGPDAATIFATLYSAMMEHANRAESRGHLMPGQRSERSVLWSVRPRWFVEAFNPPERVGQNVAHTASGRHHRNQVALIEEGQGVPERVWSATEGMCSSPGNKVISSFNPTEPVGPAFSRARGSSYRTFHLSALTHPNVLERKHVIPDAVDYRTIDARVRDECTVRGRPGEADLDPAHHDFVYATPTVPEEQHAPRADGIAGDASGEALVYRPGQKFTPQVLGQWAAESDTGLFHPASLDAAMERGRRARIPTTPPDAVGVDPAREGKDDTTLVPRWGEDAEALLNAMAEAMTDGTGKAAEKLRATRRQIIGRIIVLPKGDGPDTAMAAHRLFPNSPFHVDESSVGASVYDYFVRVLEVQAIPVSFGGTPPWPTLGEPWSENLRTAMYVRAARLVAFGLVDVPDDTALREELLAHEVLPKTRTVRIGKSVERKPSVLLIEKKKIIEKIGRSPDRSDGFVLAVNGFALPETEVITPLSSSFHTS